MTGACTQGLPQFQSLFGRKRRRNYSCCPVERDLSGGSDSGEGIFWPHQFMQGGHMTQAIEARPLWQPNPQTVGETRMAMFMQATGHGRYADLWQWSVDQPEMFWSTLWNFCGAIG